MATKEQERKALEQIRKIVAGLGEDSYIGMAFEGCFEIAEENIANDFGCSMKQRAESAEKEAERWQEAAEVARKEYEALAKKKREMSAEMDKMLDKIEYLNATVRAQEKEIETAKAERDDAQDAALEAQGDAEDFRTKAAELRKQLADSEQKVLYYEAQFQEVAEIRERASKQSEQLEKTACRLVEEMKKSAKVDALELEVIKLKARLFDLIDKQ